MDRTLSELKREGEGAGSAQTPVELYEQLQRQGYADADLRLVRAAVGEAMKLFAGVGIAYGKPHLNHCVGVASALAAVGKPAALVAAGVVHSSYFRGDFGPWRQTLEQKRRYLRRRLGPEVEQYVARFHPLVRKPDSFVALPGRLSQLNAIDRDVTVMWLANELDSYRNRSILYRLEAERLRAEAVRKRPALVEIAAKLGVPVLGRALADAIDAIESSDLPPQPRGKLAILAPESAVVRFEARAMRVLANGLRRLLGRAAHAGGERTVH